MTFLGLKAVYIAMACRITPNLGLPRRSDEHLVDAKGLAGPRRRWATRVSPLLHATRVEHGLDADSLVLTGRRWRRWSRRPRPGPGCWRRLPSWRALLEWCCRFGDTAETPCLPSAVPIWYGHSWAWTIWIDPWFNLQVPRQLPQISIYNTFHCYS